MWCWINFIANISVLDKAKYQLLNNLTMRILKFILKAFAVIIVLFCLSGLLFSEISYTTSQRINLPVYETFALFNESSKKKDWMEGLQSFKTIEEKPGMVGSRYQIVIDAQDTFTKMEEVVTAYKKNEKISLTIESAEIIKKDNYTFQSIDNQTFIQNKSTTAGKTYFLKCLYASFYFFIKRTDQETLDSFKAYAEKSRE